MEINERHIQNRWSLILNIRDNVIFIMLLMKEKMKRYSRRFSRTLAPEINRVFKSIGFPTYDHPQSFPWQVLLEEIYR